jgi:hypothetical protein
MSRGFPLIAAGYDHPGALTAGRRPASPVVITETLAKYPNLSNYEFGMIPVS